MTLISSSLIFGVTPFDNYIFEILFYVSLFLTLFRLYLKSVNPSFKNLVLRSIVLIIICLPVLLSDYSSFARSYMEVWKYVMLIFVFSSISISFKNISVAIKGIICLLFVSIIVVLFGLDWVTGFTTRQGLGVMYSEGFFAGSSTSLGLLLVPIHLVARYLYRQRAWGEFWFIFASGTLLFSLVLVGARAALLIVSVISLYDLFKWNQVISFMLIAFVLTSTDLSGIFRLSNSPKVLDVITSGRISIFNEVLNDLDEHGYMIPRGRYGEGLLKHTDNIHNQWLRMFFQSGILYVGFVLVLLIQDLRSLDPDLRKLKYAILLAVLWLGMFEPFVLFGTPRMATLSILILSKRDV